MRVKMERVLGIIAVMVFVIIFIYVLRDKITQQIFAPTDTTVEEGVVVDSIGNNFDRKDKANGEMEELVEDITVVAEGLRIPWKIVFLPGGELLVTERPGTLKKIGKDGIVFTIEGVAHVGEGGLLGMALHPDFAQNQWLYLYLTTRTGSGLTNRVERYVFDGESLTERTVILEGIPGAQYHDGGRIGFGPDGYLYITTGDATKSNLAQDTASFAGKILRLRDDGSVPEDNPYGNAMWSYGHRNIQGIAWDDLGRLWATEHGRSGVRSGFDELNLIERGINYGWPNIQGEIMQEGMRVPAVHSGSSETWAPAAAAYYRGSIFFTGLRGESLYEAKLTSDDRVESLITHLRGEFGRLRGLVIGPDGFFYLTTSNTDGCGEAQPGDDKIIKVNLKIFNKLSK